MRLGIALTCATLLAAQIGCGGAGRSYHRVTGSCEGACNHYLACKAERGVEVTEDSMRVCQLECSTVFSSREPLMAFESLRCDDAIAFIEGDSGRGPGTMMSSDGPTTPPDSSAQTP